ncbi:hypothetical protein, partial [Paraglaciecola sp.]|uniref:hypothetical protein n=1 Tax=Paraglaciecola sp. TaxID=1920173 RepID=UPI00273F9713
MKVVCIVFMLLVSNVLVAQDISSQILIKTAGNPSQTYDLSWQSIGQQKWQLNNPELSDLSISVKQQGEHYQFYIHSSKELYFNLQNLLQTQFDYEQSEFLLPVLANSQRCTVKCRAVFDS